MATVFSLPPELLLDVFALFSGPPSEDVSKDYARYLKRNRNLKRFTLVHKLWKNPAQKILQEEVYIRGIDEARVSDGEVERICRLLVKSKVQGTKYLTVDGHLNELMTKTGCAMWIHVTYLKLWTSSRNDGRTRTNDFAQFPRWSFFLFPNITNTSNVATLVTDLRELYLEDYKGEDNLLCFDPPDIDFRFPYLRRITLGWRVRIGGLSGSRDINDTRVENLAALLPIAHKLFSPSNMPNLVQLAFDDDEDTVQRAQILFAKILPQVISLAIRGGDNHTLNLLRDNRTLDNLRHLSLNTWTDDASSLFDHGGWKLKALRLPARMIREEETLCRRLIGIAKGENPKNQIDRIVIYGKRKDIGTKYEDLVDDLGTLEWREDRNEPPFEGFIGR